MASSHNTIAVFVVVVTLTGGISFWIGAVVGYSTGQRTAQYHLRARIQADVERCWRLSQLKALACRFRVVMGPTGLNLPLKPGRRGRLENFELPKVKPINAKSVADVTPE